MLLLLLRQQLLPNQLQPMEICDAAALKLRQNAAIMQQMRELWSPRRWQKLPEEATKDGLVYRCV